MEILTVIISMEVWMAIQKLKTNIFLKKTLTGILNPDIRFSMANTPATDKEVISFQLPVALKVRLQKEAAERKMSLSSYISFLLNEGVKTVVLTPEDHEEIARRIRKNEAKRAERAQN